MKTKRPMIYLSVRCSNCGGNEDTWYRNPKSIKYIKERTKNWVEFKDNEAGLLCLCPECFEKYKNGELKF